MATSYPAGLDSFTNPGPTDLVGVPVGGRTLDEFIADLADGMEAVQAELGTDPAGSESTVGDRIAAVEGAGGGGDLRWWTSYVSGSYYSPAVTGSNGTTASWGANQIMWAPFRPVVTATFDRIKVYTNAAAGNIRLAIYDATGTNGVAGALVVDGGAISTAGAGDKEVTISQSLTGGAWYWLGLNCDVTTTVSTFTFTQSAAHIMTSPSAGTHITGNYSTQTYGAFPGTAPSSTRNQTQHAGIVLRKA